MPPPVKNQMFVDFVGDRHEIVLEQAIGDEAEFVGVENFADRIHRRVDHDSAGARPDGFPQFFTRKVPMRRLKPHRNGNGAGPPDDRAVAVIDGLEHDHFVAGIEQAQKCVAKRFRRAGGHQYLLLPIDGQPEHSLRIFRDRLPEAGEAHHRRILMRPLSQGGDGGLDQFWRLQPFRESLAEIDRFMLGGEQRHGLKNRLVAGAKNRTDHEQSISHFCARRTPRENGRKPASRQQAQRY